MRALKVILIGIIVSVFYVGQVYSAPKGSNGNGNANNANANNSNASYGKANNAKANNGNANNGKSQAANVNKGNNKAVSQTKGQSAVHKQQARRSNEINRRREERNRSSDRNPSLNNGNSDLAFNNRATRANHERRNGENMKNEKGKKAIDLLGALDRARWPYNSHDDRGQGNMGKVDMLDPFGHDKDSDRKELYGNNGRPIREKEEEVNLAELAVVDFQVVDGYISEFLMYLQTYTELYGEDHWYVQWLQEHVDSYDVDYIKISVIDSGEHINYSLSLPEEFAGENLLVTTNLVSLSDYTDWYYLWYDDVDFVSGDVIWRKQEHLWYEELNINVGDVLVEDTQEVTIGEDGTFDISYDPPIELVGDYYGYGLDGGYMAELSVTVTDPGTGASYTTTFDKQINLYRCPYGKVTDSRTDQAIVGTKITVHYDDGSIVALDKATNKTANNPQITDATGRFGFILQTNRKYYLTATAEGYEDYQSGIFTEQWHVIREDIKMEPKLEQMASNME